MLIITHLWYEIDPLFNY
uniref:Uncharacterized protein n=1 Tax=Arundo donax TaxID=35708 RepID=A0A0A9CB28_ARUDO